jgi:hypothetical protein
MSEGGKYKSIINEGWDISKNKMLAKLSDYAKEGWILESMTTMKFNMVKKEPQDIIYDMDYQPVIEDMDEYLEIFKAAGWNLVCGIGGFRVFSAPSGTKPIYTDKSALIEDRKRRTKETLIALMLSVLGLTFSIIFNNYFESGIMNIVTIITSLIFAASLGYLSVWSFGLLFRKDK